MIYDWPHPALSPLITDLRLIEQTKSAGESLTGFEQVGEGITQRWAITLEFNTLKREAILPYRALLAKLRGRANAVRVPISDRRLWPADEAIGIINVPSRNDPWRLLSDGTTVADIPGITLAGAKGAKSVAVNFASLTNPALIIFPGHYFGVGDDLHIITDISWAGSVGTISFEQGFRRVHTASALKFRPKLNCRKAADQSGSHPLELGIKMAPTLDLIEILPDELALSEGGG